MNSFKKNKGITLIALVITIIVMLILVAVTINMAVNGGLFDYAGKAARKTEEAKNDEKDWAKLNENMSTDELIVKYTTSKKEDLAKLKKAYIDKYEEIMMEIEDKIIEEWTDTTFQVIKYNNNYYILTFETDNETNRKNYTNIDDVKDDEVVVVGNKNTYIRFKPYNGERWIDWAESESADLELKSTNTDTTLKERININKGQEDYENQNVYVEYKFGRGDASGRITWFEQWINLTGNGNPCKKGSIINPGLVYMFKN